MNTIRNIYRFIALCLALLMFVTSMGFIVDIHYCNGELKSFSLFGKAKSCHEISAKGCPHHQQMQANGDFDAFESKSCCSNKSFHCVLNQDQLIPSFDFEQTVAVPKIIAVYIGSIFKAPFPIVKAQVFPTYIPPIITRDIPVLIQSFLL